MPMTEDARSTCEVSGVFPVACPNTSAAETPAAVVPASTSAGGRRRLTCFAALRSADSPRPEFRTRAADDDAAFLDLRCFATGCPSPSAGPSRRELRHYSMTGDIGDSNKGKDGAQRSARNLSWKRPA